MDVIELDKLNHFELNQYFQSRRLGVSFKECFLFNYSLIDVMIIIEAAKRDCLNLMTFFLNKGAPVNELAVECAAENGHIDMVQLLVNRGIPYDGDAIFWANKGGHPEIADYLRENLIYTNVEL